jgi:hypothetical protein
MQWGKPTQHFQLSEDGDYSVAKVWTGGEPLYEAWRTQKHRDGRHLVKTRLRSAQEARDECEKDSAI